MVKKIIGAGIVFAVATGLAMPFAREVIDRHQIMSQLEPVISAHDRAAFANWSGSARSFAAALRDRCLIENAGNEAACARFETASN